MRSPRSISNRVSLSSADEPVRPSSMLALGGAATVGVAMAAAWWLGRPVGMGMRGFVAVALGLAVLQVVAVAVLWRQTGGRTLALVVVFGVLFRLGAWAWPMDLSTDLYRYAWDGRVQLAGQSPYAAPPGAESLASLRDDAIWPHINRKEALTVYPPGAQLLFLTLAAVGLRSVGAIKGAALVAEIFGMLLLAAAMRRRGVPLGRLALYAWCPLVVAEVGVSGHLDAFVLPLLLLGLWASDRGARSLAGLALGFATLMKLYPLLLFVALPRAQRARALFAAALLALTLYGVYFAISGPAVLGFLPDYARSAEDFNIGLRGLVEWLFGALGVYARSAGMLVCGAALTGAVFWIARREGADGYRRAGLLALAFVLLMPTAMHPWYALWMVPFLCFYPSPAGLWLTATLPLSYLKYGPPDGPMPTWVTASIWIPPFLTLMMAAMRARVERMAERGAPS